MSYLAYFSDRVGKSGSWFSSLIIIAGIISSIIIQVYYSNDINISAWNTGCEDPIYGDICRATSAVLRFSFALVVVFAIQLLGTALNAVYYDSFFLFKIAAYGALVIGFFYATSSVMLDYAWFARIAAFLFLIYQQIILIDFAYNWNKAWVKNSVEAETNVWLAILLVTSVLLISGSIATIGIMFWQFWGCPENEAVLIITVVLCFVATLLQLFISETGSLLVSAIVVAYCTYLCYSAVTLNPNDTCNPTLSTGYQKVSQGIGIGITVLSLAYTTYTTVSAAPETINSGAPVPPKSTFLSSVTGGGVEAGPTLTPAQSTEKVIIPQAEYDKPEVRQLLGFTTLIFLCISAYYAMVLTNWATLQSGSSLSTPRNGYVALWLQATGQWIALFLYMWSLVAPALFPDREFDR